MADEHKRLETVDSAVVERKPSQRSTVDDVNSATTTAAVDQSAQSHRILPINGHLISFPGSPYSIQIDYMRHVVRALDRGENALLEAPTGSGKTLALLCASLQWRRDLQLPLSNPMIRSSTGRDLPQNSAESNDVKSELLRGVKNEQISAMSEAKYEFSREERKIKDEQSVNGTEINRLRRELDAELQEQLRLHKCKMEQPTHPQQPLLLKTERSCVAESKQEIGFISQESAASQIQDQSNRAGQFRPTRDQTTTNNDGQSREESPRRRIFYGTRTHAQISQVVQELRRTVYKPDTVVLGSRQKYCIHEKASKADNVDDACEELRLQRKCKYFGAADEADEADPADPADEADEADEADPADVHYEARRTEIQDLEDFKRDCKLKYKTCPYYLAKQRAQTADLVLSPYNYLFIYGRKSENNDDNPKPYTGVIIDEAHNIEDAARDAASVETDTKAVEEAKWSLFHRENYHRERGESVAQAYEVLFRNMDRFASFVGSFVPGGRRASLLTRNKDGGFQKTFDSGASYALLSGAGMDSESMLAALKAIHMFEEDSLAIRRRKPATESPQSKDKKVPPATAARNLAWMIATMLDEASEGRLGSSEAFRIHVNLQEDDPDKKKWTVQFNIWCLNSAIAFSQIIQMSRSIILTSGTLSPLNSFASELGTTFNIIFESPHFIDVTKQAWIGVCGSDPVGNRISCTYDQRDNTDLQDGIGLSLEEWFRCVPDGVLVFFSGFAVIGRLVARWKAVGIYQRLTQIKRIFVEESAGKGKFDELIAGYYREIDSGNGAVLFGVCRGKASEGINFADRYARSVVIVGAPYPALFDEKVVLKREYNDRWASHLGLCSGSEWYRQKAFRAVNQALGRCIRHKHDFGAILLLDRRYRGQSSRDMMSKWTRPCLTAFAHFHEITQSVLQFFVDNGSVAQGNGPPLPVSPQHKRHQDTHSLQTRLQTDVKRSRSDARAKHYYSLERRDLTTALEVDNAVLDGFAELVKKTVQDDLAIINQRLVDCGMFAPEQTEAIRKEGKQQLIRCLIFWTHGAAELSSLVQSWSIPLPTGLVALLKLKGFQLNRFTEQVDISTYGRLSIRGTDQEQLQQLKELYIEVLGWEDM